MIPSQYSVISLLQLRLPLIEFKPTMCWLLHPFQRIPLSKVFAGDRVQVLDASTPSSIDTTIIEIPKSQVSILVKRGDILVNQVVNSQ